MSGKKNKRNRNIKNKKSKQNLTQEEKNLQAKIDKKFAIIKEHKILFWLILFPPIGLYKTYKYGILNKWISAIVGLLIVIFLILCIDVGMNPNRVTDMITKEAIIELGTIGEPRYVSKKGYIDNKYLIYDVLTTDGKYNLYLKLDENNKYVIDGIFKIIPDIEFIKEPSLLDEKIKDIFPQILLFFNNEENKNKFGEIEELISTSENYQDIKTTKGTYTIEVKYDGITSITAYDEEGNEEVVYTREVMINLPKQVEKFLKDNKKEIGEMTEIISCEITNSSIEYIFKNDNSSYYKVEYKNDGTLILYNGE